MTNNSNTNINNFGSGNSIEVKGNTVKFMVNNTLRDRKKNTSEFDSTNIDNFKTYNTYIIDDEDYQKSREERVDFLLKCDVKEDILNDKIPKKYEPIPDFIWLDIIKNVLKPLEKNEDYLKSEGFLEFNLSGHTEGKKFRPWQMADDQRM